MYPDGRWICVIILFVTVRGHACISYQDILYFAWSPLCMVWTALLEHIFIVHPSSSDRHCHSIYTATQYQLLNQNSVTAISSHVLVDAHGCYQPLMVAVPRRSSGCMMSGSRIVIGILLPAASAASRRPNAHVDFQKCIKVQRKIKNM